MDKGQKEAAMSLGIPYLLYVWDIIMPQALKNILPALVNESINVLKDTALISTLGNVQDILRSAQIVGAEKYVYFEPLMIAGRIYDVLVMTLTFGASALERKSQILKVKLYWLKWDCKKKPKFIPPSYQVDKNNG